MERKTKNRYFFIAFCIIDESVLGDKIIYGNSNTSTDGGRYIPIETIQLSLVSAYKAAGRDLSNNAYARISNIIELSKSDYEQSMLK